MLKNNINLSKKDSTLRNISMIKKQILMWVSKYAKSNEVYFDWIKKSVRKNNLFQCIKKWKLTEEFPITLKDKALPKSKNQKMKLYCSKRN